MKQWAQRFKLRGSNLLIVLGITAALFAIVYFATTRTESNIAQEMTVITADRGDIEKIIMVTGTLKPSVQVNVGAQVNGQIKYLYAKQGDKVFKGQILAEIDPAIQKSDLRNAIAKLSSVRAQKASSEAILVQYRKAFERQKKLRKDGSGIDSDYEQAQAQYEAQQYQVKMNEALIVQSEMEVETANANLSYTQILAPIAGEVLGIVANEGQTIVSSQTAPTILVLANLDKMQIQTRISEADIQSVHSGQPLYFYVLADPDKRYEGTMGYVQPVPQEALEERNMASANNQQNNAVYYSGTFEVDNKNRELKTSMTAQVFIRVAQVKGVVRIPVNALGRSIAANEYEITVLNGNQPETKTVVVGITDRHFIQIIQGLEEGEQVIVSNNIGVS